MKKVAYLCVTILRPLPQYKLIKASFGCVAAPFEDFLFIMRDYILWLLFGDRDRSLLFLLALLTDIYLFS